MECDQRFPSQPFVILIVDQFLGTVVACLNDRNKIATFIKNLAHCWRTRGKGVLLG